MKTYQIKKNNEVIQSCIPEGIAMLKFLDILNQGEDVKNTWHDINNPSLVECRGDRYQITEEVKSNMESILIRRTIKKNGDVNIEINTALSDKDAIAYLEMAKFAILSKASKVEQIPDSNIENKLNQDANI